MKAWIERPVSEPPEKNGWYLMVGSECFIPVSFYWDNWLRCWKSSEHDKIETDWKIFQYTHYLVPAEGNFLTDAELEVIKHSEFDRGFIAGYNAAGICTK